MKLGLAAIMLMAIIKDQQDVQLVEERLFSTTHSLAADIQVGVVSYWFGL
jgi:hypothetical protein